MINLKLLRRRANKLEEIELLKIKKCNYFFDLLAELISIKPFLESKISNEILEPLIQEFTGCTRIEENEDFGDARLGHLINLISIVIRAENLSKFY
jgi:hypothetical protein